MDRLDSLFSNAMDRISRVSNHETSPCDVMTGFKALDNKLCGFDNGDLIIVGSRPRVGKTSFIISCVYNNVRQGVPVLLYSLDMTQLQIAYRLLSIATGIDLERIRKGDLNEKEREILKTQVEALQQLPLGIEADAPINVEELCELIEKQVKESGAKIVYIDYLQLMMSKDHKAIENRYQEVCLFSRSFKALAHRLNIPIVVASQLNRKPENRQEVIREYVRPNMYDLRDSGTICEDANLVFLLGRPELVSNNYEDREGNNIRGLVEVIVAKHNNGQDGVVELVFNHETCAFSDKEEIDLSRYEGNYGSPLIDY